MQQYLSAHDVANDVRMRRTRRSGAFVVVEGDLDARFYGRFVEPGSVVIAHGRDNALTSLQILVGESFAGVLAIVDRDFWALGEGSPPDLAGLLCTDGRDLEGMILRSPALDKLLGALGSTNKLDVVRSSGRTPAEILAQAAGEIGYLRWLCERDKRATTRHPDTDLARDGALRLKFQDLTFGKFVDRRTLEVDARALIETVANHSQQPLHRERVEAALAALRQEAREQGRDGWEICAGHDLVELLAIGLCSLFGSCQPTEVKKLDRMLIISYDNEHFVQTALFAGLCEWQTQHPERSLLRAEFAVRARPAAAPARP